MPRQTNQERNKGTDERLHEGERHDPERVRAGEVRYDRCDGKLALVVDEPLERVKVKGRRKISDSTTIPGIGIVR
jgi:hypothetical protein